MGVVLQTFFWDCPSVATKNSNGGTLFASISPHRLALSLGAQPVSRKGKPSCCYAIHLRRTDP
jgi:hypothetical protein